MLPIPNPQVIFKSVSEGAVLFHTGEEVYFGLDPVGAQIWELLPPRCRTWEELLLALQKMYPEVEASTIGQDTIELLRELRVHGLVSSPAQDQDGASSNAAQAA